MRACVRACVRACMSIRITVMILTLLYIDAYQLFVLASKRLQKKTLKNIYIINIHKTIDNTDMNVSLTRFAIQAKGPDGKWTRKPLAYRESSLLNAILCAELIK